MMRERLLPLRRRAMPLLALLGMLAGCEAPTATRPTFAYDPTALTGGQLYRWASGSTIRVFIVPPPVGSALDLVGATSVAVAQWNDLPLFREFRLVSATSAAEANVVVMARGTTSPVAPSTACPFDARGSAGYTYFCPSGGRASRLSITGITATEATVLVSIDVGKSGTQSTLEALLVHELGHVLGIGGHSLTPTDVMYGVPTVTIPSGRDAQTLQYLLGQKPAILL